MAKRRIGDEIVRTLGDLVSSAEAGTVRKTHRVTTVRRQCMKSVRAWAVVHDGVPCAFPVCQSARESMTYSLHPTRKIARFFADTNDVVVRVEIREVSK